MAGGHALGDRAVIVAENAEGDRKEFEALLDRVLRVTRDSAKKKKEDFLTKSATDFEEYACEAMREASKGTCFEGTIKRVPNQKFPDITIRQYYGVEVKTTNKDQWKSTGNSVLELTRVEGIERIYLFFGKLSDPPDFAWRLYEECLYDIAVTHSPRYLIDVKLEKGATIFDKMGVSYEVLRRMEDPVSYIVRYYREKIKITLGRELWWMGGNERNPVVTKPYVSLWNLLSEEEKKRYRIEAMALFPELFGASNAKYNRLTVWLAARHGVVNSSLRDVFTAGGKRNLTTRNGGKYFGLPRIYEHLREGLEQVKEVIEGLSVDDARYYWRIEGNLAKDTLYREWAQKVVEYSQTQSNDAACFVRDLLLSNDK